MKTIWRPRRGLAIGHRCRGLKLDLKDAIAGGDQVSSRRGAAMVFALVALLVASLMIGALLKTAAMSHRQLKRDEYRLQASLLADAGCDRARVLLQNQPDFTSGEWTIPADDLGSGLAATVQMTVTTRQDEPSQRMVTASSQYPAGHPDLVRVTRQIPIP